MNLYTFLLLNQSLYSALSNISDVGDGVDCCDDRGGGVGGDVGGGDGGDDGGDSGGGVCLSWGGWAGILVTIIIPGCCKSGAQREG